jgi:hypothetical protein
MAAFQFEVAFSAPQVRRAVRTFYGHILKRQLDWKLYVAIGIVVVALILRRNEGAGWFEWSLGGALFFVAAFLYFFYRAYLQQSLDRLKEMKQPTAQFDARDDSLTVAFDLGSSTMPWSTFTAMIDSPDTLLLVVQRNSIVMVPKAGVDEAALTFLRERVASGQNAV